MTTCSTCSAALAEGARFCTTCGTPVPDPASAPTAPNQVPPVFLPPPPIAPVGTAAPDPTGWGSPPTAGMPAQPGGEPPPRRWLIPVLAGAAVVVLLLLGVGIAVAMGGGDDDEAADPPRTTSTTEEERTTTTEDQGDEDDVFDAPPSTTTPNPTAPSGTPSDNPQVEAYCAAAEEFAALVQGIDLFDPAGGGLEQLTAAGEDLADQAAGLANAPLDQADAQRVTECSQIVTDATLGLGG